ncbi:MAG: PaaI family thioesterase [Chloroflexi bacterium]|nr:PaaI family thioesterase [Chloroflexota bacterium]
MRGNHCFGCGEDNPDGLGVRSSWDPTDSSASICEFTPASHHSAYPHDVVNGGVIASVIDCHAVCTAIADAYRRAGREIGDDDGPILYATGSLQINYRAPSRLHGQLTARARIVEVGDRTTRLEVTVVDRSDTITADGTVTAVRVPGAWANPDGVFAGT